MAQALLSLDAPRPITGRARLSYWVLFVGYAVLLGITFRNASDQLPPLPAAGLAHAVIAAYVCGITALLMIGHARSTGRRGFLMIGGSFLYMALILAVYPMYFPSAFIQGEQIWGGPQSPLELFFAWHLALPIGLASAAWLIYHDQRRHRRPSLSTKGIVVGVMISIGTAALALLLSGMEIGPAMANGDVKTEYARLWDLFLLLLNVACIAVTLYCARNGSIIGRWLVAMAMLSLADALLLLPAVSRYSLGWYASRFVWLAAVSVLLAALIWNLSRIDRANSEKASVDTLTGASSRATLLDAIYRDLDRIDTDHHTSALLWLDLDGFKGINDQLGHQVGDEVLRRVVERLLSQVRIDDHVGRLGGDEFGVLLSGGPEQTSPQELAERLLVTLREPIRIGDLQLHLTAAIGIASAPHDAVHAEGLLQCADLAMYAAKRQGGDCYEVFDAAIGRAAQERIQFRHELAQAIREDDFALHYQPIYETATMRMAGAEVLARWVREGVPMPAEGFIRFAEESGQIVTLGHLLMRRAAQEAPAWFSQVDDDFFLAINLSVYELADTELIDSVLAGRLGEYAHRVVVEVTESSELQENSDAKYNIDRLQRAGMRMAVDDFGVGFSNFSRLAQLRPALLKFDGSIVQRAAKVEGSQSFLSAATSLAASLHCDVVAEGIEGEEHERLAAMLGIRYVQGYFYGYPAPMDQFLDVSVSPRA